MDSKNYYIADMHLGHDNILRFDNRPYNTCEEMHDDIKRKWNEHVPKDAHVYILGDVIWRFDDDMRKYMKSLNGVLHLIRGNHDRNESSRFKSLFCEITPYKEIKDKVNHTERRVILSHYYIPFYNSHYYNGILLHGHSHVTPESKHERLITNMLRQEGYFEEIYNVGCMYPYMDYTPRTLEEIIDRYKAWENGLDE